MIRNGRVLWQIVVSDWTKIPVQKTDRGGDQTSAHIWKKNLHKRVIGQDEAVKAVAQAVKQRQCRPERSEPSDWFLPVPGTDRCR